MPKSVPHNQIRALAMAMAGAVMAAVAMMFVPVGILENLTGSTGLSELIPAARAPLGDTARALISFGSGALILAVLAYLLTRQDSSMNSRAAPSVPASKWAADDQSPSLLERLGHIKMPSFELPKMPWHKGDGDITELDDLPKLRIGDSHPDAPPRRPIVASQDLPVLEPAEMRHAPFSETPEVLAASVAEDSIFQIEPPALKSESLPIAVSNIEPTLAEMVEQLEAAVAERQKQLRELETVATNLAHSPLAPRPMSAPEQPAYKVEVINKNEIFVEPSRAERPPLEAVPSPAVKDDDMDSALAAALATLHRMNATAR